jgi:hypothetical protein
MLSYDPEFVQTMRAALDEAVTKIPADQVTLGLKAYLAERILKAAAAGRTNYDDLLRAASEQVAKEFSHPR